MKVHGLHAALASCLLCCANASASVITINPLRDTALFAQNPDLNLGGSDLIAGTTGRFGEDARSLLYFDVASAIPAGSTITSVTFRDKITRQSQVVSASAYELHRFLTDWTEGTGSNNGSAASLGDTTWNSQHDGSLLWSLPGGQAGVDFVSTASSAGPVIGIPNIIYTIPSTPQLVSDVQAWLDNPVSNYGWIMLSSSEGTLGTARRFSSRESLASGGVLDLTITYSVPEPATALTIVLGLGLLAILRIRSSNAESITSPIENRNASIEQRYTQKH